MTPTRTLHLAPGLSLPLDAVSRTFGILAVRGAGKSNTAAVMAEEMFAAGLPFVVIDPVGSWYGLRSSADGTAPGLILDKLAAVQPQQIAGRSGELTPRGGAAGGRPSAGLRTASGNIAATRPAEARAPRGSDRPGVAGDPSIGKSGLRRMLIALAQRPNGLTRGQLGVRARVSSKGGSFDTYLSKARVNAWVDTAGDRIQITAAGLTALGSYEPLPTGAELLEYYVREFGASGAARMLRAVAAAYPSALSRAELSAQSGVSAAGGSFDTYLSKLRTLELVEGKSELRASEELFS